MRCGLQSDCATSAMQGLRPLCHEHNNDIHAMVILIFSNASFVSVCGIYSVSVSSAVKGIPVLFLHIHSPLHPVEAKVFLHVSDPQVQKLERPPAFSLGTKTVPRFFQELSSSAEYEH